MYCVFYSDNIPVEVVDFKVLLAVSFGLLALLVDEQTESGVHKSVELETVRQWLSDSRVNQEHVSDGVDVRVEEFIAWRFDELAEFLQLFRIVQLRVEHIRAVDSQQDWKVWFIRSVAKLQKLD